MLIPDDKKVDVLLALLKERYEASHKMRERSYKFCVWILGVGIAFVWLIFSQNAICVSQRAVLSVLVIAMGVLSFLFLKSIDRGFVNNRTIMIRLERILQCYEKQAYGENESVYPTEYEDTKKRFYSHFVSLYLLLGAIGMAIIVLLWM